jgi:mannose-1-phosphate guanylyltransferase
MIALLLAGGLGTRLRPLTENHPKPMALVGNRPWLEHLILHLKGQGVEEFVIAVKHYPEMIQSRFGNGRSIGVKIEYAVEKTFLGTAGAIKNAESLLSDRFLVVNADIVHQVVLEPLLAYHAQHDGKVTIGLIEVDDPSQYGVVEQNEVGEILRFVEKPNAADAPSRMVNAGIYVMEKEVLKWIPENREVSIERETFPLLIQRNVGVYGKRIGGYWMDMGTTERYRRLHWDLLERKLSLPLKEKEQQKGIWIGREAEIGPGVLLVPPVLIGDEVHIGEGSRVGPYVVIGDCSEIGRNVRCQKTILWNGCHVHHDAQLNNCIFGYGLEVGSRHILHEAVMNRLSGVASV